MIPNDKASNVQEQIKKISTLTQTLIVKIKTARSEREPVLSTFHPHNLCV